MAAVLLWIVQDFSYVRTNKYEKAVVVKNDRRHKSPVTSGTDSIPFCHFRMLLSGILERSQNEIPAFAGMTGVRQWNWSPPFGKFSTGFSESDVGKFKNVDRLWLDVCRLHSNFSECDSTAAINSAGPETSRRIGNWRQSVLPIPLSAVFLTDWNSVMVESVRLVLQRWRGVCSFSQTMRSTGAMKKVIWCMTFAPKNEVGPENDLLRSYSKVQKYDDISIT